MSPLPVTPSPCPPIPPPPSKALPAPAPLLRPSIPTPPEPTPSPQGICHPRFPFRAFSWNLPHSGTCFEPTTVHAGRHEVNLGCSMRIDYFRQSKTQTQKQRHLQPKSGHNI